MSFVNDRSTGEKNGKRIGMKSSIVVKDADKKKNNGFSMVYQQLKS